MPENEIIWFLKQYQHRFHQVVPFNPGTDKLIHLDMSDNNKELTEEVVKNTSLFTGWINQKIQSAGARYAIGGYHENRSLYNRSRVFDSKESEEEPRRLHLGIDIWGKPHTHVRAPADAIVNSFAFNNNFGDYGATIILTHRVESLVFYTLYGHLSLNSIKNLQPGVRFTKGDVFAEFGIPYENGQWPPHLHFQIILDLEGYKGDYPGVCKLSEQEKYLSNCPDPDIILQLNQYL